MRHLLNNLSEEEKNSIIEQHEGGIMVNNSKFKSLLEGKLGNSKPLVEQYDDFENEEDPYEEDDYTPTLKEKIESVIRNSVTNREEVIQVLEDLLREKKSANNMRDRLRR